MLVFGGVHVGKYTSFMDPLGMDHVIKSWKINLSWMGKKILFVIHGSVMSTSPFNHHFTVEFNRLQRQIPTQLLDTWMLVTLVTPYNWDDFQGLPGINITVTTRETPLSITTSVQLYHGFPGKIENLSARPQLVENNSCPTNWFRHGCVILCCSG